MMPKSIAALLLFSAFPPASAADPTPTPEPSWWNTGAVVEAVTLEGSLEYKKVDSEMTEFGVTSENQVTLNLLPFRFAEGPWDGRDADVLSLSITADLSTKRVTEADITLFRSWIVSLLAYRRDLFAAEEHDVMAFRIQVPIYVMSGCDAKSGEDCALRTTMVITIGAETGYRWMRGDKEGAYFSPMSAAALGVTVLNRFFLGLEGSASFNMITGSQENYAKGKLNGRIGMRFSDDLMFSVTAGWAFYGAKKTFGFPAYSNFLGARLDWNFAR